jgi:hypothetical protein
VLCFRLGYQHEVQEPFHVEFLARDDAIIMLITYCYVQIPLNSS